MRGKVIVDPVAETTSRITPAYAGKSSAKAALTLSTRGSPPPMRGKGIRQQEVWNLRRITPAYAGKRQAEYGVQSVG